MNDVPNESKWIDDAQVTRDFQAIEQVRRIAWQRNPQDVLALIERLRVQMVINEMPRRRRQYFRALIDYYEEVLDERLAKKRTSDRKAIKRSALGYIRDFIKGLED